MLIEEYFEVYITTRNIEFYRNLGFDVNLKDKIKVTSSQLTPYNKNRVKVKCDYCGEIVNRCYRDHYKIEKKKTFNGKHACKKCSHKKSKEITEEFFDGIHPSQTEEAIAKRKKTNIEKYGVEMPFESEKILQKSKEATLKKYGVDNIFKHKDFVKKRNKTMLEKYGYISVAQDPKRIKEIIKKRNKTLYERKKAPCSLQQQYIHDILGGELNYSIDMIMLDIGFPEDKIYIEYQGSGHNLDVKLGKMTEEDFNNKEINRYYFLKGKGWKMIEIVSKKDLLPKKEKLIEMFEFSKEILENTSFIQFDIDRGKTKYHKKYFDYDFGELITYSILHKSIKRNTYKKLIN